MSDKSHIEQGVLSQNGLKSPLDLEDKTYVVVDVETTGGKSREHRITEIGAVKILNGKEVDRFHSLINPERKIPPFISKLTGISDCMVKEAPLFKDVAQDFLSFCKHAVFTAHFVQFDYGFIQSEFRRIGVKFRSETFCTCNEARKEFKGLGSYGLKNLSRELNVNLENHHRAMDDAKAASEILIKILKNRKLIK